HLIYDENAQLQNASFADYLLPLATDFPNVRGITLELRRSATNPLGAKGAGEGGIVSVAATIGNAVAAALVKFGAEPKELPLTPARIWALIEQSGSDTHASPYALVSAFCPRPISQWCNRLRSSW